MDKLKIDLKYALRALLKNKGMSAAAIVTLALGIGINTTIFSLVNAILLRPLPYPNSELIMSLISSKEGKDSDGFSVANFLDVREQNKSFQAISAFGIYSYDVSGDNEPESLVACRATPGFFEVYGVKPFLGRTFLPEEEIEGRHQVIMLSNSLWKQRYAADPAIVGKTISLNGLPHVVIGVMPEKFAEPSFVQLWTPMTFTTVQKQHRGASYLQVVSRLRSGISQLQAQAELKKITSSLITQYPEHNTGLSIKAIPAVEAMTGKIKTTFLIFWVAVIFVLLIACANLANLMLAATMSREKEFSLRIALGASPGRLRRQLLTESMFMAITGGLLGILFSLWAIPAILALTPQDTPRVHEVTMNSSVLLFSIFLSALTGILFGIAPAFRASKNNLSSFLKEGTSGAGTGPERIKLRNLLVTSQMAVVLVLLVGAGLMIRSFAELRSVAPGFDPEKLLNVQLFLPHVRYQQPDARRAFASSLLEKVRNMSEIESAAIASPAPFDTVPHLISAAFQIKGQPSPAPGSEPTASYIRVSEDYFSAMKIPLRKGRVFQSTDHEKAIPVAVVNEAMDKRFWPSRGAIGEQIILGVREPITFQIVGVVGNVKELSLSSQDQPQIYVPFKQSPSGAISLIVRTKGQPEIVVSKLKNQLWSVDPALPAQYVATAENLLSKSLHRPLSNTVLLSIFAGMAFLLAIIGLYGVVANSVYQRTREIGIRMSLGAQRTSILGMILRQGLRMTLMGIVAGTFAALLLTHLLSDLLYKVNSRDPFIFIIGAILMGLVSVCACYLPARRAMKVDPIVALHYE